MREKYSGITRVGRIESMGDLNFQEIKIDKGLEGDQLMKSLLGMFKEVMGITDEELAEAMAEEEVEDDPYQVIIKSTDTRAYKLLGNLLQRMKKGDTHGTADLAEELMDSLIPELFENKEINRDKIVVLIYGEYQLRCEFYGNNVGIMSTYLGIDMFKTEVVAVG